MGTSCQAQKSERFKVLEKISSSSHAKFYVANYDGQIVTIKIYTKNCKKSYSVLEKELLILKKLNHQNILQLSSTMIELPLIAACEGSLDGNLETLLKSYRAHYLREDALSELFDFDPKKLFKISIGRILKWLRQVASALAYMSERKIIHTDVRAFNILYTAETAKLANFDYAQYTNCTSQEKYRPPKPLSAPEMFSCSSNPQSSKYKNLEG